MISPRSCDTFVVLPPLTKNGDVIFGKNSDRPQHEVQEVVLYKRGMTERRVKCTYITIEGSINPSNSVILSKPAWMWGAEMGANEKNVVIGNEAVWTNNNEGDGDARQKRLLGMDLVRLGLERGNTAVEAVGVISDHLEKYGQGGPCSEMDDSHFYHNSFLIADPNEAWVLETSGKLWAAEKIETGYRNISNGLTIGTKFDRHSAGLRQKAKLMGVWDGKSDFNFTKCFSSGGDEQRQVEGEKLLKQKSASSAFRVKNMFEILRHKESRICRGCDDTFPTQGSQVSSLGKAASVHWFTATPDPSMSYFKPFVFTPNPQISIHTISPDWLYRQHRLYQDHSKVVLQDKNNCIARILKFMEEENFVKISDFMKKFETGQAKLDELDSLMNDCVEKELVLYT